MIIDNDNTILGDLSPLAGDSIDMLPYENSTLLLDTDVPAVYPLRLTLLVLQIKVGKFFLTKNLYHEAVLFAMWSYAVLIILTDFRYASVLVRYQSPSVL